MGIETTQHTGLWWIYDCAYRVADVDDGITNTTGALIGALCAAVFLTTSLLPALYGSGASWGQRAVWLRGQWQVAEGSAQHSLLALARMLVGFGGYVLLDLTSTYGSDRWAEIPGAALTVFVLVSAVSVLFTPSARGLSFRLTSGKVVDARADNDAPGT